jgi:hypothetical protein
MFSGNDVYTCLRPLDKYKTIDLSNSSQCITNIFAENTFDSSVFEGNQLFDDGVTMGRAVLSY